MGTKVKSSRNRYHQAATDITERKRAEEAMREGEERLKTIFDSIQTGVVIIDAETHVIVDANPAAAEMIGAPREKIVGNVCHKFICPDEDGKCPITDLGQVVDKSECALINAKGETISILKTVTHIVLNRRKYLVEAFVDITERKRVEEALQQSEERLRAFFENAPDAIFVHDDMGNLIDVNRNVQELIGYSREELIGKNFMEMGILSEEQILKTMARLEKSSTGELTGPFESELITKEGSRVYVEIASFTLPIKGNTETWGIARDITERKQTEEQLQESEARYRDLFENAHDMIQSVTLDGRFVFANRAWLETLGYTEAELPNLSLFEIIHPESLSHCGEMFARVIAGESVRNVEATFVAKDGRLIQVEGNASVRRIGGEVVATHGIFRDITERKRAENALRKTEEQLRQSQKMEAIGRLAGGVAHDFNNLLTVIMVCSDMLLSDIGEDDPMRQDVEEIRKAAERAASLTRQLLVFSRRQVLETEILNLNSIVGEMDKLLHRLVGEDIQLETILDTELDSVNIDRGGIEQVVMNLVVNARDAMPNGGKITIKIEPVTLDEKDNLGISEARPGRFVRLSVADTGIGMSKETIEHIFEPFFTTKGKREGTGLGLSTAYGIVKQSGGWINVYSELGQGSTFKIYLPVSSAGSEDENKLIGETPALQELKGNGERILLVEDEAPIRAIAQRLLSESGYVVFAADSAEEALTTFNHEDGNFQLVLSDVVLPNKSGVELASQLHALKPELPVIFSSGYADEKSQRSLIHKKGYPFVQKPYTTEKLLRSVKEMIMGAKERAKTRA